MAIWEQPEILSGYSQAVNKDAKADLALCIIHTGLVTTEWAVRFKYMQFPTHMYFFNKNQPYDTAREMVTRAALEQNTKYIFMLDSVPQYTPILVRDPITRMVDIKPISELAKFNGNTLERTDPIYPYEVFEKDRWCKINKVIRHPFDGHLKRINCQEGFIDITPNHSIYKFGQGSGESLADASKLKIGEHLIFPRIGDWQRRETEKGLYYPGDEELAWLHGFFVAEGSISSRLLDISVSNTKEELLQKAKEIFESNYNIRMSYLDGQEKNYVPKIEVTNTKLAHYLYPSFYTDIRDKKIPQAILNAPEKIINCFLQGFLDGDGHITKEGAKYYSNNSQTVQAGLIFMLKRKKHNFSVYTRKDKLKAITLIENIRPDSWYHEMLNLREEATQLRKTRGWGARKISRELGYNENTIRGWIGKDSIPKRRTIPQEIKDISDVPYRGYVYDLATETHRFSAGVGFNLVHNTDVIAPVNTVPVLIQWAEQFNLPVLSGLYWAKKPGPPMPAAWIKINEKDPEHPEFAPLDIKPHMPSQTIVPADVTGAGCMLIKTDVFRQLEKSNPNLPFWQWGLGRKGLMQTSEDFYFCLRCVKELNIHPHVATAVQCDHISTCIRRGSDGEFELSMSV